MLEEGTLTSWFVASAPSDVEMERVTFRCEFCMPSLDRADGTLSDAHESSVGDACALRPMDAPFDAILAANLMCRCVMSKDRAHIQAVTPLCRRSLPDPTKFLDALPHMLTPDGVVVLVSPYSWLEVCMVDALLLFHCRSSHAHACTAPLGVDVPGQVARRRCSRRRRGVQRARADTEDESARLQYGGGERHAVRHPRTWCV